MDAHEALRQADLGSEEVRQRVGARPAVGTDAVRQRTAALLEAPAGMDDPSAAAEPGDVRRCGALIVRLGAAATMTGVAAWMGWTLERTTTAVAELDRRLEGCGLQVSADAHGHLRIRERARLRARPQRLASELVVRLDDPAHRHALAHLVRGDHCAQGEDWLQPLLDLGAAVTGTSLEVQPSQPLAAAFAGVRRRVVARPLLVVIQSADVADEESGGTRALAADANVPLPP